MCLDGPNFGQIGWSADRPLCPDKGANKEGLTFRDMPDIRIATGGEAMSDEKDDKKPKRMSWDDYFMAIARVVSSRSTCHRKFVGAVIVRDKTILSTGYNGSIRGMPHCTDVGHMMEDDHCVATIHAESNAILQAAKNGVMIDGGTVYVTAPPCWSCFKQIVNAGCKRIVYGEFYRDERIFGVAEKLGVELVHVPLFTKEVGKL
jgi:dCMP deaminase